MVSRNLRPVKFAVARSVDHPEPGDAKVWRNPLDRCSTSWLMKV